jgi:hypothetical protein
MMFQRVHGHLVAGLIVGILVQGCSLFNGSSHKVQGAGGVALEATSGIDPDVTPFVLEVVEELNDGDRLIVKGRILPKSTWPADAVVVRLSALDRAGQQRVSFHKMQDIVSAAPGGTSPTTLQKGVAQTFNLSLPLKGITSYQLDVLWGKDAELYTGPLNAPKKDTKQFLALRNMEVHRLPGESCASPDECLVTFTITGELFNSGAATVKDVVIVAGFGSSDKLDLPSQILENEKRVEVPNLSLAPGSGKRFKISLEKLVPPTAPVAPQPVVRIASFRSE